MDLYVIHELYGPIHLRWAPFCRPDLLGDPDLYITLPEILRYPPIQSNYENAVKYLLEQKGLSRHTFVSLRAQRNCLNRISWAEAWIQTLEPIQETPHEYIRGPSMDEDIGITSLFTRVTLENPPIGPEPPQDHIILNQVQRMKRVGYLAGIAPSYPVGC